MFNTVTIVGVGLISGSFSLALKDQQQVKKVIGVSRTGASAQRALELGIIDEVLPLEEAVRQSDLIYVAIPVDVTIPVMKTIMDAITANQMVADAGSTKQALCEALADHPMRSRFVASHPMWGTEYSGPEAAVHDAFRGRSCRSTRNTSTSALCVSRVSTSKPTTAHLRKTGAACRST